MANTGWVQGVFGLLRFLADLAGVQHASFGELVAVAIFVVALIAVIVLVLWHAYSER